MLYVLRDGNFLFFLHALRTAGFHQCSPIKVGYSEGRYMWVLIRFSEWTAFVISHF